MTSHTRSETMADLRQAAEEARRVLQARIEAFMAQAGLNTVTLLQRRTGITTSDWSNFLGRSKRDQTIPGSDKLEKIRKHVTTITDRDVAVIQRGYKARFSLKNMRSRPAQGENKKCAKSIQPLIQPTSLLSPARAAGDAFFEAIAEAIVARLQETSAYAPLSQASASDNNSPHLPLCVMPLLLTAESFRQVDASQLSTAEIEMIAKHGVAVLQSARQFYNFLAQLEPTQVRDRLLRAIADESNELVLAQQAAEHCVPSQGIAMIAEQRKVWNSR